MKQILKRAVSLFLVAVVLLGMLAGCGKKEEESKRPTPEFVYIPEYIELSGETGDMGESFAVGERIYFTSWMPVGKIQELYPSNNEGYYFSIDGDNISAYLLNAPEYDDGVVMPMPVPEVEVITTASTGSDLVIDDVMQPMDEPETELTPEELAEIERAEAEKQAAIEKYVQYDANGELIVPEGYEFYEYDKTEQVLMRMNVDGTDVTRMENYELPKPDIEGAECDGNINRITGDAEGRLWIMENVYAYSFSDDGEYTDHGESYFLRQLDETGAEISRIDLNALKEHSENEYFYINSVCMDGTGNIYVSSDRIVMVLDSSGELLFTLEVEDWVETVVQLADGRVAAAYYKYEEDRGGQVLHIIDTAKKDWGECYPSNGNMYNAITGSGDYDLYYNDSSTFSGYDVETGTATPIVNWLNSDINADHIRSVVPLKDGRIAVVLRNWNSNTSNNEMAILSKQPYSALGDKTVLTLATLYDYSIRDGVIEFNRTNDKYRIEVSNYSQYNNHNSDNEEDWNAGLTKLSTEIISGQVPDILVLEGLPYEQYMAKGLLEDLYPFIDNDPELGRDKLVQSVLKAAEHNGALYQAFSNFNIRTIICPSAVVGTEPGWTLAEMRQLQDQMPPESALFRDMTKEEMLRTYFLNSGGDFIDWETGQCSFNGEEFISLLEYANTFPAEIDWENYDYGEYVPEYIQLQEGTLLGRTLYVWDMMEFLAYKTMFGGEMTVKGYPSADRKGSILQIEGGVAMSSKCVDKEAAWQFIREYFLPKNDDEDGVMYYGGLSVNQEDMDAMIAEMSRKEYRKDENGKQVLQPITSWWMDDGEGGHEIEVMPAEQEDIDEFMAMIENADKLASVDEEVLKIVVEDAAAYFAGQKSAKDVANVIQSKIQTYVNERM